MDDSLNEQMAIRDAITQDIASEVLGQMDTAYPVQHPRSLNDPPATQRPVQPATPPTTGQQPTQPTQQPTGIPAQQPTQDGQPAPGHSPTVPHHEPPERAFAVALRSYERTAFPASRPTGQPREPERREAGEAQDRV